LEAVRKSEIASQAAKAEIAQRGFVESIVSRASAIAEDILEAMRREPRGLADRAGNGAPQSDVERG